MTKNRSFILSDESVNTYGFRVLLSGTDLAQFRRNPVMYYNHDEWDTPIGLWENIRIEDGKLLAEPVFDMEDENGKKIAGKVERGFLRMVSIGLRALEWSDDSKLMLPGQTRPTVSKWQLREASIVGIGANHNALRLYDEKDNLLTDEQILKLFDNCGAVPLPPQKNSTMKKETLTLLDVADNATDEQLHDKVKQIVERNKEMEAENKTLKDAAEAREAEDKKVKRDQFEQKLKDAVKDGRLNAGAEEDFLEFYEASPVSALKALTRIPKRESVKGKIDSAQEQLTGELSDLNKLSWDELDKGGKLATLKDKYPDIYAEKFEGKFGKKPTN